MIESSEIRCPHCFTPVTVDTEETISEVTCDECRSSFDYVTASEATHQQADGSLMRLGQFELLELLGQGGFGSVWKAHDTDLDRIVALKRPHQEFDDETAREKFFHEAQAAAQLNHPNIVAVHQVGRDGRLVYIATDYIDGASLKDWTSTRKLTWRESAMLCRTIASALAHAHEAGVIHRDLKPDNIMMDLEGSPYIMDFGLAKRTNAVTVTIEGQYLGTPAYMSPEQARGQAHLADARSDLFSLGVIFYELLVGNRPFQGDSQMLLVQIRTAEPGRPRKLNSRLPRDLETICLKCLEKNPEQRFQTATELVAELDRLLTGMPILARPVGPLGRSWRWCRRNPAVAGLTAAVAMSLVAGTVVSTSFALEARAKARAETEARQLAEDSRQEALAKFALALDVVDRLVVVSDHLEFYPSVRDDREQLLLLASKYYEELANSPSRDRQLQMDAVAARIKLGKIHHQQGQSTRALQVLQEAEAQLARLQESGDLGDTWNAPLTNCRIHIALALQQTGKPGEARLFLEKLVDTLTPAGQERHLAKVLFNLGTLCFLQGDLDQATRHLRRAVKTYKSLAESEHATIDETFGLATSLSSLGQVLAANHRHDEAIDSLQLALPLHEELVDRDEADVPNVLALAKTLTDMAGSLITVGRERKAIEMLSQALEELQEAQPGFNSASLSESLATAQVNLAQLVSELGANSAGRDYAEAGLRLFIDLQEKYSRPQDSHGVALGQLTLAVILHNLDLDNEEGSEKYIDNAARLLVELRRDAATAADRDRFSADLAEGHLVRANLLEKKGETTAALQSNSQALQELKQLDQMAQNTTNVDALARCYAQRSQIQMSLDQITAAKESVRAALKLRGELAEKGHYRRRLVCLLTDCVDPEQRDAQRAVSLAKHLSQDQPTSARTWLALSAACLEARQWTDSLDALQHAEKYLVLPGDARHQFYLAITYWRLDQKPKSRKHHKQALEAMKVQAPGQPELVQLRDRVDKLLSDQK